MFITKKITGIDIGSKAIKMLSVKIKNKQFTIEKALIQEIPNDLEEEQNFKAIFSLINQLAIKKSISLKNVAIFCPDNLYNSVNLILPKIQKKQDIKSAILWELKNKFGLDPTTVNMDYFINSYTEDGKVEYQVFYSDKKNIQTLQNEAMRFNINIKYIDINYIAYSLCFNSLYPQDENIKVLLDVGYKNCKMIFLLRDKILFIRDLNLGLINIFSNLTDDEIKAVKIRGMLNNENNKILNNSVTEILLEISKTIDYFINGLKYPAPSNIFCNGGLFAIPGVYNFFKENMPYPVILNNVLELSNYNGEYKSLGFLFHLALGLSIL